MRVMRDENVALRIDVAEGELTGAGQNQAFVSGHVVTEQIATEAGALRGDPDFVAVRRPRQTARAHAGVVGNHELAAIEIDHNGTTGGVTKPLMVDEGE